MKEDFKVIKGTSNVEDLYTPVVWEPVYETSGNITSLFPNTLKTFLSERSLRNIAEKLEARDDITVTYNRFREEDKAFDAKREALEEMFKDDDKVIVLNPNQFRK